VTDAGSGGADPEAVGPSPPSRRARPLARFLVIVFVWSWGFDAIAVLPGVPKWLVKAAVVIGMWGPGIAALAAQRGPLRAAWSRVFSAASAPVPRNARRAALALGIALPPLFAASSIALTVALGVGHLKVGRPAPGALLLIFVAAGIIGPLLNFPSALGEELGWRGFLAPHLRVLWGDARARAATGIIWGLWHLPLLVAGLNYPGHPWLAIPLMVGFTSALNMVFIELAERGGSVAAPTIAHASVNAYPGLATLLLTDVNPCVGAPVGVIAWIPIVVAGALLARGLGGSRRNARRSPPW